VNKAKTDKCGSENVTELKKKTKRELNKFKQNEKTKNSEQQKYKHI
jgi:hypothetical protein